MKKLTEEAVGGLSAGIVGTVIGYPLDLIKTRMQTSSATQSTGIMRLGLNIANQERGWDVRNALAGMTATPLVSAVSTVEHMIKTQMQLDNINAKRFKGSFHCLTSLVKSNGAREILLGSHTPFGNHVAPQLAIPLAGGISGAFAWFASFPLDCIKAGIQGQIVKPGAHHKQLSAMTVFKTLWSSKGVRGLYSGVTPSIIRAFLVSSSRFSAYEFALWLLQAREFSQYDD
eukprot:scaffold68547_cov59-Attheya_sp.AAC.6